MEKVEYCSNQGTRMQRTSKYVVWLIRASGRLWTFFLLLISGTILISIILGIPAPSLLILFFGFFIPGYAFVALVFSELDELEKVVASIGFSIGFFVGLKSFTQTFGFVGLFSEVAVLTIFSVALLFVKLVK
jgi:uncharacterized membrane protein